MEEAAFNTTNRHDVQEETVPAMQEVLTHAHIKQRRETQEGRPATSVAQEIEGVASNNNEKI